MEEFPDEIASGGIRSDREFLSVINSEREKKRHINIILRDGYLCGSDVSSGLDGSRGDSDGVRETTQPSLARAETWLSMPRLERVQPHGIRSVIAR